MALIWLVLSLTWTGSMGLRIQSSRDGLCLEESSGFELRLQPCKGSTALQQWMWTGAGLIVNEGTQRCLSPWHRDPVQTLSCGPGELLEWVCRGQQLIGKNSRMMLSMHQGKITLQRGGTRDEGRSLDARDICQHAQRSRRDSEFDTEEPEFSEEPPANRMTEAQAKFLQWYYRTEDPSSWKFAMLGFAFVGLLIGAMLLVMGMMANRNRKQLARYKAASKVTEEKLDMEELQVIVPKKNEETKSLNSHEDWEEPLEKTKLTEELNPGEITVTWKDGNKSTLYPEPMPEEDDQLPNKALEESRSSTQVIASSETIAF